MNVKQIYFLLRSNLEAIIWLTALIYLAVHNAAMVHYSLCPFNNLGWDFCPGCGLGSSISLLFRGQLAESFNTHPLGIFAVCILFYRIIQVVRESMRKYKMIFGLNINNQSLNT